MFMVYKLSGEMTVFDRERTDKMYSTIPYIISWYIANAFINILLPLIYTTIIYFMVGLRYSSDARYFAIFLASNVALQYVT